MSDSELLPFTVAVVKESPDRSEDISADFEKSAGDGKAIVIGQAASRLTILISSKRRSSLFKVRAECLQLRSR